MLPWRWPGGRCLAAARASRRRGPAAAPATSARLRRPGAAPLGCRRILV